MFGGVLQAGNSNLFDGPLGVVKIGFKGYDLGKTTAEAALKFDQDIKDIIYQQDGTKAADRVRTGAVLVLSATFGEISTGLLRLLMAGVTSGIDATNEDFGVIGRSVYQSMRDNEAGALRIAACDGNGVASVEDEDHLNFYEAIANVNGNLVNWGADTQRNLPVEFHIFYHEFADGESATKVGAFGYWGAPADSDVPATVWPDVTAPLVTAAAVTAATTMDVTFDENITEVNNATTETKIMASIDGVFIAPTASACADKVLTLTFPALTFAAGDVVLLSMSAGVVKDAAANVNAAVLSRIVTNPLV